ncbi:MAG: ABC transporter permease, partial [Blastocatellia bacterium]
METLNRNRKNFGRLPLKLIALVGVIVPRRLRADWRQEWEAELRHRETLLAEWDKLDWKHKLDLLRRSLGAFWDALLLQPRRMEDEMFQDLRFGARMLLKSKSFTLMAVLTLTLGIGANTAIFSVVNALLLKPLPYTHAERLVWIEEADPQATARIVPGADFLDWRERSQLLESIAAYSEEAATLTGAGEPERLEGYRVSDSFFPTLGAPLLLGRNFLPEEDRAGGERVVILSHSLWQRRFSADQGIVGKAVRLDEEGYRVVGVMRPDFRFFLKSEFWLPLAFDAQQEQGNQMTSFAHVFARLKPGVTQAQAQAELETIKQAQAGAADKEKLFSQARVQFTPLHQQLADGVRHLLLILWG